MSWKLRSEALRRSLLLSCLIAAMFSSSVAQIIVPGGRVSGRWAQVGVPYIVTGNIYVEDSLIIGPGVSVRFDGVWELEIRANAKFVARGSDGAPIIFEPHNGSVGGLWNRIFLNTSGGDDSLEHCVLRYGTDAIYAVNSTPFISNCSISGNRGSGDHGYGISLIYHGIGTNKTRIIDCNISDNTVGIGILGIGVSSQVNPDTVLIERSTIHRNSLQGIFVWTTSIATQYGGYVLARIANSVICNNRDDGVHAYTPDGRGTARVTIVNSIIAFNSGSACVRREYATVNPNDIRYNCFWENQRGDFIGISGTGFGLPPLYRNRNDDSCDIQFNTYRNPSFLDTTFANYRLRDSSSVCVDAGSEIVFDRALWDPDSTQLDIGAYYVPHHLRVSLVAPKPDSVLRASSTVVFNWVRMGIKAVRSYWIQIATDETFNTLRVSDSLSSTSLSVFLTSSSYWWRVRAQTNVGWGPWSATRHLTIITTIPPRTAIDEFALRQNYPNPFNPATTISYVLGHRSSVVLKVFDLLGREVMTLVDGIQDGGVKSVQFDGSGLSSGVYLYKFSAGSFVETKKLLLMR